jgi:hypothetical protein
MLESLLNELRADGHLVGEPAPPHPAEAGVSNWILALQVIGGWLAAIFMLLFLGMGAAPLVKGASGWFVVGLIMTALTGSLIGRVQGTVLRQFLLVASLAGHGALLLGAGLFGKGEGGTFFVIALYETVLLLWVAWMPHRLVAALVGAGSLAVAFDLTFAHELMRYWVGLYWFAVCTLWHLESRWQAQRNGAAVYALACALTLLCFVYTLSQFFDHEFFGVHKGFRLDAALICGVSATFVLLLSRPLLGTPRQQLAVALLIAVLVVTWPAPAVGMGALALVFGFARGHRWLMWVGGALLVFGVGRFYYDLHLTLLYKSGLMLLGGVLLLSIRALIVGREELP